jgi:glycerate dehydrogenase
MKIAVLNECFLKQAQLDRLKALGEVTIYDDTNSEEKVIERLRGVDAAIVDCFVSPFNKNVFNQLQNIKYISINSIGYDLIDLEAARVKGIQVSNVPGYSVEAVAEHAIALMFAVARHLLQMDKKVRENPYEIDPSDKSQLSLLGFNLRGKTLGIIGLGNIGKRVSEIGHGIGMRVIGFNRSLKSIPNVEMVSLDELLKRSDIVSLHTPLNKESEGLISTEQLKLMKSHAVLINTARGKIVDTQALYYALNNDVIAGAGLDTLAEWDKSNPLLTLENTIITPHGAWFTRESFENLANMVVENVEAYAKGSPINLIT